MGLHHFLHRPDQADVQELAGKLKRPKLEAFLRHCKEVIERDGLAAMVTRGRVESIEKLGSRLHVRGPGVDLHARRILVATGSGRPRFPAWARRLQSEGAAVSHVFDSEPALAADLLGGGISAVQRALMVHRATQKPVRIWMRRPVQVAELAYDREWAKHRFQPRWASFDDAERFRFLARHTTRGSVPPGLAARLARAVQRGRIEVRYGHPKIEQDRSGKGLVLHDSGEALESAAVTLATGFHPETLPAWLHGAIDTLDLPTVQQLPRLDEAMEWGHGIHVSGPLARHRLGPMAENLIGARWASSKLPGVRMLPA